MPLTRHTESNFDIDFNFGSFSEQELVDIFEHSGRCEVKTERDIWQTTGNIAIEYRWKGKPSGISVTDAHWWIHCLSVGGKNIGMLTFRVDWLRRRIKVMLKDGTAQVKPGGDNNGAKLILLKISRIFDV